jgi:hypothetical protein
VGEKGNGFTVDRGNKGARKWNEMGCHGQTDHMIYPESSLFSGGV